MSSPYARNDTILQTMLAYLNNINPLEVSLHANSSKSMSHRIIRGNSSETVERQLYQNGGCVFLACSAVSKYSRTMVSRALSPRRKDIVSDCMLSR